MKISFTTLMFILAVLLFAGVIAYLKHKKEVTPANNQSITDILYNEADGSYTDTLCDD